MIEFYRIAARKPEGNVTPIRVGGVDIIRAADGKVVTPSRRLLTTVLIQTCQRMNAAINLKIDALNRHALSNLADLLIDPDKATPLHWDEIPVFGDQGERELECYLANGWKLNIHQRDADAVPGLTMIHSTGGQIGAPVLRNSIEELQDDAPRIVAARLVMLNYLHDLEAAPRPS